MWTHFLYNQGKTTGPMKEICIIGQIDIVMGSKYELTSIFPADPPSHPLQQPFRYSTFIPTLPLNPASISKEITVQDLLAGTTSTFF